MKYKWKKGEEQPLESEYVDVPANGQVPKYATCGIYYLWLKIEDNAGNVYQKKCKYTVGGWQKVGNEWTYYEATGVQVIGQWKQIGTAWYYLKPGTGYMAKGWVYNQEAKVYYYCHPESGVMLTGWQYIDKYWYYLDPDNGGAMKTGWLQLGSSWYYLKPSGFTAWSGPDGSMLYSTTVTINGQSYTFNASGVWVQCTTHDYSARCPNLHYGSAWSCTGGHYHGDGAYYHIVCAKCGTANGQWCCPTSPYPTVFPTAP